jgi:NitT/TauT family transport system substrate-binding protein
LRWPPEAREWADQAPAREIAAREAAYFPGVDAEALADAIARYQELGCWDGGLEITRELYEKALDVFLYSSAIARRHAYEEVVVLPPRE